MKTNRVFGVELEGYVNEDLDGGSVKGWDCVHDGSLNDDGEDECYECDGCGRENCCECDGSGSNREECEECYGAGELEEECQECYGKGIILDIDGEEEECDCCGGEGTISMECCNCDGEGYVNEECRDCYGEGSIGCGNCEGSGCVSGGRYGIEFVSPKLDDIDDATNMLEHIERRYNFEIERDCGTHVHVDGRDLDANHVRNLVTLMAGVEPIFYSIVKNYRYNMNYCKVLDRGFINTILEYNNISLDTLNEIHYGSYKSPERLNKYDSERYYGLWFYRGSIEFRYFEGAESKEKLANWIELCVKLVDFSKHSTFEQCVIVLDKMLSCETIEGRMGVVNEFLGLNFRLQDIMRYDASMNHQRVIGNWECGVLENHCRVQLTIDDVLAG
jgi:hypothetical protein